MFFLNLITPHNVDCITMKIYFKVHKTYIFKCTYKHILDMYHGTAEKLNALKYLNNLFLNLLDFFKSTKYKMIFDGILSFFCNNCYNDGKIIWVKLSNDNYISVFLFRIPQFIFCLKEAGCKP